MGKEMTKKEKIDKLNLMKSLYRKDELKKIMSCSVCSNHISCDIFAKSWKDWFGEANFLFCPDHSVFK
jgi:hypothetical protein